MKCRSCGHDQNMHYRGESFCMAEVVDDNEERNACFCGDFTAPTTNLDENRGSE